MMIIASGAASSAFWARLGGADNIVVQVSNVSCVDPWAIVTAPHHQRTAGLLRCQTVFQSKIACWLRCRQRSAAASFRIWISSRTGAAILARRILWLRCRSMCGTAHWPKRQAQRDAKRRMGSAPDVSALLRQYEWRVGFVGLARFAPCERANAPLRTRLPWSSPKSPQSAAWHRSSPGDKRVYHPPPLGDFGRTPKFWCQRWLEGTSRQAGSVT